MSVSAIVVTFNSEKKITACLKALTEEISMVGGEILVYDNNSTDATIRMVESEFPDIKILRSSRNIGFAAGCNFAAALADNEYLLFGNPDMIIDKGSLKILLEAIDSQPDAGAVVARMRHGDGRFQSTCRVLPDYRNILFSRGSALRRDPGADFPNEKYTLGDSDKIIEVPAAAATCILIGSGFFQNIGGFDDRFFMFMEDTDLCRRIGQAGKKIYFIPRAGAVHYWGEGAAISEIKRKWFHHMSVWRYFLKHYPNGFSLFVLPIALLFNFVLTIMTGLDNEEKKDLNPD